MPDSWPSDLVIATVTRTGRLDRPAASLSRSDSARRLFGSSL